MPKSFQFPKVDLKTGWELWILCLREFRITEKNGTTKAAPIPPFRMFIDGQLPKKIKYEFQLAWRPIFTFLEKSGKFSELDSKKYTLTATEINFKYEKCITYLREKVSYCFNSNDCLKWHTARWSKKVFPSSVHRFCTDEDELANFKNGVYTPQRIVRDVGFERNRKRKKESLIRRRDYTGSRRPTCKSNEGLM